MAIMKTTKTIGEVICNNAADMLKRMTATRFMWRPGRRPVRVPIKIPAKTATIISIIILD